MQIFCGQGARKGRPAPHLPGESVWRGWALLPKLAPPLPDPLEASRVRLVVAALLRTYAAPTLAASPCCAEETSEFVSGQMRALPPELRLALRCGLLSFYGWVQVVSGRTFASLEPEEQVRLVHTWASSPNRVVRQVFRPLLSTSLLYAYEHKRAPENGPDGTDVSIVGDAPTVLGPAVAGNGAA